MSTEGKNLSELLAQWMEGQSVDWRQLYEGEAPPVVRAPTYPFARKSFWFETQRPEQPGRHQEVAMSKEKPEMHDANRGSTENPADVAAEQPQPLRVVPKKPSQITLSALPAHDLELAPPPQAPRTVSLSPTMTQQSPEPAAAAESPVARSPVQVGKPEALQSELAQSLAGLLQISPSAIGPKDSFVELGVDSLVGTEWAREINQRYGAAVRLETLLQTDNLTALVSALTGMVGSATAGSAPSPTTHASAPVEKAVQTTAHEERPRVSEIPPAPQASPAPQAFSAPPAPVSPAPAVSAVAPQAPATPAPAVAAAAPAQDRMSRARLEKELAASLAQSLYMDASEIDLEQSFMDMGLDSIIGVEWIHGLNRKFGVSLQAIQVYDYPNIIKLAGLVEQQMRAASPPEAAAPAPAEAVAPAPSREVAPAPEPRPFVSEAIASPPRDVPAPVATAPAAPVAQAPRSSLLDELVAGVAQALFKSPAQIDVTKSLSDVGLDPFVGEEWLSRTNKKFGLSLREQDAYGCRSITELAERIARELKAKEEPAAPSPQPSSVLRAPEPPPARPVEVERPAQSAPRSMPAPESSVVSRGHGERIAIVAMSGRYPGARNLDEYWENLAAARTTIREVPESRWDVRRYYDPTPGKPGKVYSKWLGALDDVDCFDPGFFKISPAEAEEMDPQHRLFLEEGYRALERMGFATSLADNRRCGVYLGIMSQDYRYLSARGALTMLEKGNSYAIGAARLAYHLDLKGPAIPVDTACSSALVATHLACQALRNHEVDMALVGGVTLYLTVESYLEMCASGMLAPDGRCKTFDDGADGFVPGEGVGVLVLKRLSDAERDRDLILGTIIGSGINQDGKTNGITAPSVTSQTELIRDIYKKYGIDSGSISYVETHGTGTKLGDPIELTALATAFRDQTTQKNFCALGSVKSNIGHTSAAAGVAGIHKVLLSMRHQELVPTLNFKTPNRLFDFASSPFYVNTERKHWAAPSSAPRRAAVSSFGFSGTNAHVVIEEYVPSKARRAEKGASAKQPYPIPVSALNEERLKEYAKQLLDFVAVSNRRGDAGVDLADLAYTMQVGRNPMEARLGLLAHDGNELEAQLRGFLEGRKGVEGVYVSRARSGEDAVAALTDDDDVAEAIDSWIRKGKYRQLLELWTRGVKVDWARLHESASPEGQPQRIEAPTYPFARERYWVSARNDEARPETARAFLHPLLQENTSTLQEHRFSSTFTGEEFFLRDHRIGGERVLPSAAWLEMARAAVHQSCPEAEGAGIGLKNVVWLRPMSVSVRPRRVHLRLQAEATGEVSFAAYTDAQAGEAGPVVHCQGVATPGNAPQGLGALDLGGLQERFGAAEAARSGSGVGRSNRERLYETFGQLGMEYGPGHRALDELYLGRNEVLAKVSLPSTLTDGRGGFELHPSILDAAMQALLAMGRDSLSSNMPLVPLAIDSVESTGATTETMWAWLRRVDAGHTPNTVKVDIDLCDTRGEVRLRLKGLSARASESLISRSPAETGTVVLRQVWKEAPGNDVAPAPTFQDRRVFFCGVTAPSRRTDFVRADAEGASVTYTKLHGVTSRLDTAVLPEVFGGYAAQLFERVQQLLQSSTRKSTLIQVVVPVSGPAAMLAALGAMLKTASLENPLLSGQVIAVDEGDATVDLLAELERNALAADAQHVRYEGGRRWVSSFEALKEPLRSASAPAGTGMPWKEGGVYLITGGAGGLGRIFADEMTRSRIRSDRQAGDRRMTLILTGRSHASRETQALLEELRNRGVRAEYRTLDVNDRAAVERLVGDLQREFGALNGIIHSAGVTRDNYILKKTQAEFEEVLAPKVTGVVNLDLATQDLRELDFFVLFSSGAGVTGNVGQADYSTANAFMDAFAAWRTSLGEKRSGKTLSINWPLWQDGGMRVDRTSEELMEARLGMTPMTTAAGVAALYEALASSESRVVVMSGNLKRITTLARGGFAVSFRDAGPAAVAVDRQTGGDTGRTRVEPAVSGERSSDLSQVAATQVQGVLSRVLKLPVERLRASTHFENYGIDSIAAMKLTTELEKTFGPLPKTLFFECQNSDELSRYLVDAHRARLVELAAPREPQASAPPRNGVAAASTVNVEDTGARSASATPRPSPAQASSNPGDIAVIGVSGRYPKARSLDEYWQNLRNGRDCIEEIPKERWDWREYYTEDRSERGRHYSKWGGFLADVDAFDPLFFNISPKEAKSLDPQERLFLEHVWGALEDAGYKPEDLRQDAQEDLPAQVGVYVGVMYENYQLLGAEASARGNPVLAGGSYASIANRVSFFLNLHGPSMAVDTMCSSSLMTVHLACQDLKSGRVNLAIAGGVNLSIHPNKYRMLSAGQFLSTRGRCESFGEGGDGYIPAEGVGVLLLKRLADAERDGDPIYGVIKGTAVNHGGKTNGYTVPNPNAQREVIARALKESGVDPRAVSYIEAHGTGTKLGDPIEIAGLAKAFSGRDPAQRCWVGSVKSNLGHCEGAAGVAALTKVLLQLKHREIVPSLHSQVLNPHLKLDGTPFVINQGLREWTRPIVDGREFPRIAGVSSFGAGGSNAHAILAEYVPGTAAQVQDAARVHADAPSGPVLVVLSAKKQEQLKAYVESLREFVATNCREGGAVRLMDLAYTLQVGRVAMEERLALVVRSADELHQALGAVLAGSPDVENVYRGRLGAHSGGSTAASGSETELHVLADRWVKGQDVDWKVLYRGAAPRRVSAPTYPFARDRHWIDMPPPAAEAQRPVAAGLKAPEPVPAPVPEPAPRANPSPAPQERVRTALQLTSPLDGFVAPTPPSPETRMSTGGGTRSRAAIEAALVASLSKALFVKPSELDVTTPFTGLGLDSIVGVEWIQGINREYGVSLRATDVYDYPSVADLAVLLEQKLGAGSPAPAEVPTTPAPRVQHAVRLMPVESAHVAALDEGAGNVRPRTVLPDIAVPANAPEQVATIGRPDADRLEGAAAPAPRSEAVAPTPRSETVAPAPAPRAEAAAPAPRSEASASEARRPVERIAIVGMSGRYPGARNLAQYWDNLAAAKSHIEEIPASRWNADEYYDPKPGKPGKVYCKWIGLLEDVDRFDPTFFKITPAEAEEMDPQHRLFLEEGYRAFEHMGYAPASLSNRKCGVYLGIMNNEYSSIATKSCGPASGIGSSFAIGAARLAYHLNLKGPAIPIDTACSSALVATHLACQALQNHEVDMALVGGVTLYLTPDSYLAMCAAGMLSPEGLCKTFDDSADGFVPGEGVGALVLKRLSDAERDQDHILGTIIGSGINQDGRTNGITAPSVTSQTELTREVYRRYGIDPTSISYVETHGTGTKLGDPIELTALSTSFRDHTTQKNFCALGSVKSNIGHTSAAAGVASIQKVLLCIQNQELVPTLNFKTPNRHFDFAESPFYVNTERKPWGSAPSTPRRAAVSSFGFSGTNAHVVIEEYVAPESGRRTKDAEPTPVLVPLSAKNRERLTEVARNLLAFVAPSNRGEGPKVDLRDLAYTFQVGRDALVERLGLIAHTAQELEEQLRTFVEGRELAKGMVVGRAKRGAELATAVGEDVEQLVENCLRQGQSKQLMNLWVGGAEVDWAKLYEKAGPNGRPRRIPAPTYPFARERHWVAVNQAPAAEVSLKRDAEPSKVRPVASQVREPVVPEPREKRPESSVTTPVATPSSAEESIAYVPVWEEAPAAKQNRLQPSRRTKTHETVLVVHRNGSCGLADALAAHHQAAGRGATVLRLDVSSGALDAHGLENWLRKADAVDVVYFIAGCDEARLGAPDATRRARLESGWDEDEFQFLRLVQVLTRKTKPDGFVDFYVVTLNNHRLDGAATNPYGGGVTGLAYAVAQGDHRFLVRNVDVSPEDLGSGRDALATNRLLSMLLDEEPSDRGDLVKYRSGRRYRQAFARLDWRKPIDAAGLKNGGVYVIVGGAGNVGGVVTRLLIEKYRARVVWIGRRPADSAGVRERLAAFRHLGSPPSYVQADVTDLRSMNDAVRHIKEQYGRIDGAVFSGMVFDFENAISRTTEPRFREIFDVKAKGTRVFYAAFEREDLDFLCFFSSAQAFAFSGAGKLSAYAAGTTFSDTFVRSVQATSKFPVGIINWGFWQCALEAAALGTKSIGALSDEQGFEVFERFVSAGLHRNVLGQVVALVAPREVQRLMNIREEERVWLSNTPVPVPSERATLAAPEGAWTADGIDADREQLEAWMARLLFAQVKRLGARTGDGTLSRNFSDVVSSAPGREARRFYERWWSESLNVLEAFGYVKLEADRARVVREPGVSESELWKGWEEQKARWGADPSRRAQVRLLDACLKALPEVLTGKVLAADVLFPGASTALVECMYRDNPLSDLFNDIQGEALVACVREWVAQGRRAPVRILEVGAGTGGTTATLLDKLRPYQRDIEEYRFTDVSKVFLMRAEESLAPRAPYLRTSLFDVERPLAAQDIQADHYDVVVATNVLHATKSIRNSLRNVKACMRAGAVLILNEVSDKSLFTHLTFGLLEGWWLHQDAALRIPGSPAILPETWREVLEEEGFQDVVFPARATHRLGQQVIVARSNGVIRQSVAAVRTASRPVADTTAAGRPSAPARVAAAPSLAASAGATAPESPKPAESLKRHVVEEIHRALQVSLKMAPGGIDDHVAFSDYGIDSILGVRFIDALKEALGLAINTAVIFDHATVDRLADYIVSAHGEHLRFEDDGAQAHQPELPSARDVGTPAQGSGHAAVEAEPSDIAVVGLSGQFPDAEDVHAFWENLIHGRDGVGELPPQYVGRAGTRASGNEVKPPYRWGGILADRDCFDPAFFNISPDEARSMIPHQRLILQETWKGLEDAGYNPRSLGGTQVGVFVGAEPTGYTSTTFTGSSDALIASRLSYYLNLRGPAFVVNTGCSSSAAAIHLACESLRRKESSVALAAGVFAAMGPKMLTSLSAINMLPAGGRCRSFDASADGTVFSEGVGVVVLKRLADAIADGDAIYGTIKASGMNQDGASNGIMSPSGVAQEELITNVYERFAINPERISYVEAHGTGTQFGDAVEVNALSRAFSRFTSSKKYCALGSAKAHIGHTAAAAGVVGLIKILLSMKYRMLPAQLNFEKPNPMIGFEGSAFYVNTENREWRAPRADLPLMAALNSFGHSGTNVHIVVQEYVASRQGQAGRELASGYGQRLPVPLSARDEASLKRYAARLLRFLDAGEASGGPGGEPLELRDVAYTLQRGREAMKERVVFLASDLSELASLLRVFVRGEVSDHVLSRPALGARSGDGIAPEELELRQAALRWVQGGHVEWSPRSASAQGSEFEQPPRRVHLPSYPFAKQRYWADEEDVPEAANSDLPVNGAGHSRVNSGTNGVAHHDNGAGHSRVNPGTNGVAHHEAQPAAHGAANGGAVGTATAVLRRLVAEHLNESEEAIDVGRSLIDLGLSSTDLVSVAVRLRHVVRADLMPSIVFDYPTVQSLASHLSDTYPDAFGTDANVPAVAAPKNGVEHGKKASGVATEVTSTRPAPAAGGPARGHPGNGTPERADAGPSPDVVKLLERFEGGSLSLEETIALIEVSE